MRGTFLSVFLGQKNWVFGEQNATMQEKFVLPLLTVNQSKEGALGEAVCQAQGLTKPKKSSPASGGAGSGKFQ